MMLLQLAVCKAGEHVSSDHITGVESIHQEQVAPLWW